MEPDKIRDRALSQPLPEAQAQVDPMRWMGPVSVRAEAMLRAAGVCLAEMKLPTFGHLDGDRVFQTCCEFTSGITYHQAYEILENSVMEASAGTTTVRQADPKDFSSGIQCPCLFLEVSRGEESHRVVVFPNRERPFNLDPL